MGLVCAGLAGDARVNWIDRVVGVLELVGE